MNRFHRWPTRSLILLLPILVVGCTLLPGSGDAEREAKRLEDRVGVFQHRYVSLITQAALEVEERAEDVELKRKALYLQLIIPPYARDAVYRARDPLAALMDVWALARQTRIYYETGPGSEQFGEHDRLFQAGRTLEEEVRELALDSLGEERFASAEATIAKFCDQYPAKAPFSRESIQGFLQDESNALSMGWFFDTGLAPLRAIGGLDQTAIAVHEVARSADEMTAVVSELPNRVRLQTQLMMYDIAEQPAIGSLMQSVDRVSRSAEQVSGLAGELPERLRVELETAIDDIEAVRPGFEQTIEELRATLEELTRSLDAATGTTEGVARASAALEGTLSEFRGVLSDLGGDEESGAGAAPPEPAPPAEPGEPFDIEDYTRTAEAIAQAADSLRGAIAEARETIGALETSRTLEKSAAEVEGIARTVTLLALALFAGCAAIVLASRVVARRLARPRA